jgi:hypothetical protein
LRGIFEFLKMICLGQHAGTVYKTNYLFYFVFFGLFQNRSVCFGCFDIDPKHRNEPKQTEEILYWFCETNRKTTETGTG